MFLPRCELSESRLKKPDSLAQDHLLLGVRRRVHPLVEKYRVSLFTFTQTPAFQPVMVHGQIVSDAKHPCLRVPFRPALYNVTD
jgi:hypothetical protein